MRVRSAPRLPLARILTVDAGRRVAVELEGDVVGETFRHASREVRSHRPYLDPLAILHGETVAAEPALWVVRGTDQVDYTCDLHPGRPLTSDFGAERRELLLIQGEDQDFVPWSGDRVAGVLHSDADKHGQESVLTVQPERTTDPRQDEDVQGTQVAAQDRP